MQSIPCFQLSPRQMQDIKPQESGHFSQDPKIFHFEALETARLLTRHVEPGHALHHENLNKADTFPQTSSQQTSTSLA